MKKTTFQEKIAHLFTLLYDQSDPSSPSKPASTTIPLEEEKKAEPAPAKEQKPTNAKKRKRTQQVEASPPLKGAKKFKANDFFEEFGYLEDSSDAYSEDHSSDGDFTSAAAHKLGKGKKKQKETTVKPKKWKDMDIAEINARVEKELE